MKDEKMKGFGGETRPDHFYLRADDDCYFFIEYTARRPFNYSDANSFITNLKKKPSKRGTYEWVHKVRAIADAAETLRRELPDDWLENSTFVPIPPSKARDDPEYDDRMSQVLSELGGEVDVRELVYQTESMEATHVSEQRHSIEALVEKYEVAQDQVRPKPTHIVIVDDMMTAAAHFRAMCRVLKKQFPGVPISGVFLARRVFPDDNE
jgi:hypothetical protein